MSRALLVPIALAASTLTGGGNARGTASVPGESRAPSIAAAPTLVVGTITSEKQCRYFQESAGRSALVVTPDAIAAASSWATWWVRDCVDNFASMKTSLQAALSAGGMSVRTGSGRYTVSGRISDVVGGGGPAPVAPRGGSFGTASNRMMVNMDVTVRDGAGRIVFGGLLSKTIETGYDVHAGNFRAYGGMDGQGLYTLIQHEVALAVARLVCFHFTPLQVTGGHDEQITLNYGAPLLKLGTIVQVQGRDGDVLRFSVTSAMEGTATAKLDGDGDMAQIGPGSVAAVIEADDPAANGRRLRGGRLP